VCLQLEISNASVSKKFIIFINVVAKVSPEIAVGYTDSIIPSAHLKLTLQSRKNGHGATANQEDAKAADPANAPIPNVPNLPLPTEIYGSSKDHQKNTNLRKPLRATGFVGQSYSSDPPASPQAFDLLW
jgi:hypothetical protein